MAKTIGTAPSGGFELLGLTLLVSTPSDLNQAWANARTGDEAVLALDRLNFSSITKPRAADFLRQYFNCRKIFKGIGDVHQAFYGGSGQHPTTDEAKLIIAALQKLDSGGS